MTKSVKRFAFLGLAALAAPIALLGVGKASDHADTPDIAANPGTDITDVYVFPSETNRDNVVLVMNVHPLIAPGQGLATTFDPNVLYQFKIDQNGDGLEDAVIQAKFSGTGPNQTVAISGPIHPSTRGTRNRLEEPYDKSGKINTNFSPHRGMVAFAGAREDPFFFDLEQFFNIFPDRATPLSGIAVADPNTPKAPGFRAPGAAKDFLSVHQLNVLSIVVEVPRSQLVLTSHHRQLGVVGIWATTSTPNGGGYYQQVDRLSRPVINEVFATVANNRHKINDEDSPSNDVNELANDIQSFMTYPAGRSQAIIDVVKAVVIPDEMKVDLSQMGPAAYLGVETGGATGGKFGGRKLQDDVVDISLGIVFGDTIPALGLAPDDGNELPSFTTDNVDASGKHFRSTFPYLGDPR